MTGADFPGLLPASRKHADQISELGIVKVDGGDVFSSSGVARSNNKGRFWILRPNKLPRRQNPAGMSDNQSTPLARIVLESLRHVGRLDILGVGHIPSH